MSIILDFGRGVQVVQKLMKPKKNSLLRLTKLVPLILLSPFIGVRLFFFALGEFPGFLSVLLVLTTVALVAPDFADTRPGGANPDASSLADEAPPSGSRLSERLDKAAVSVKRPGKPTLHLRWDGLNFTSPELPPWNWVGPMLVTVRVSGGDSRPQQGGSRSAGVRGWEWKEKIDLERAAETCIWVHPVRSGVLALTFRGLPLGGKLRGFVHLLSTGKKDSRVKLRIVVDGKETAVLHPALRPGGAWEFETSLPGKGTGQLELEISAEGGGKHHVCLDAVVEPEKSG